MTIRYKLKNLDKLRRAHDPQVVDQALRGTITKASARVRTLISRRVRERYSVSAAVVARHTRLDRYFRGGGQPTSILRYLGSKIGLINFAPRIRNINTKKGPRRGVSVKQLRKGKRTLVKKGFQNASFGAGFIARGNQGNEHIFARTGAKSGSGRDQLVSLKGPAVAEMVGKADVMEDANRMLATETPKIFDHELEHFLLRQVGLR